MLSPANNSLKICQFNVENLFLFMDGYNGENLEQLDEKHWQKLNRANVANKPIKKALALKDTISEISPDVLMLNEVGGKESLNNFNHYFLNGAYEVHLIEGNSDRGIDVGFLLKKDLGFKSILLSHRQRPINFHYAHEEPNKKKYYFSRDVAELRLFGPTGHSPQFIFLLVHLKSKLDPYGLDPLGQRRRKAELNALVEIYNEVKSEVGRDAAIIVGGDFNGVAAPHNTEESFHALYEKTDLLESFTLKKLPMNERYTQTQILPGRPIQYLQIDYLFVSQALKNKLVNAKVYRFKDKWGEPLPVPTRLDEREQLPSDHYPIILCLQRDQ